MNEIIFGVLVGNIIVALVVLSVSHIHDRAYFKAKIKNLHLVLNSVIHELPYEMKLKILERAENKMREFEPDPPPESGITRDDIPPKG